MSLQVDRQYRLLNQIFRLCCASPKSGELALVIGAQSAAQLIEQRAVRSCIAIQAGKHQGLELNFAGRHACISLLVRWAAWFGYGHGNNNHGTREAGAHRVGWSAAAFTPLLANGRTRLPHFGLTRPELP